MSELAPTNNETKSAPEISSELVVDNQEKHEQPSENQENNKETISAADVRQELLEQPQTEPKLELPFDDSKEGDQPQYIDKAMKKASLKSELNQIQQKLTPTQRLLSATIHQPLVRKASDVGASTVARTSGLLGGGILAFSGSLILLLTDKVFGFQYNYLVIVLLFIVGYIVAVIIEAANKTSAKKKN